MKKVSMGIFFCLLLVPTLSVVCQDSSVGENFIFHGEYPLNDTKTGSITLLGTMHISSQKGGVISSRLEGILKNMDRLYLEVDFEELKNPMNMAQLAPLYIWLPEVLSLTDVLGEQYEIINARFLELGENLVLYDKIQPWYLGLLYVSKLGEKAGISEKGSEEWFLEWGKANGRKWDGLESVETQFKALSMGTYDEQVTELMGTLEGTLEETQAELEALEKAWLTGDEERLNNMINVQLRESVSPEKFKALLDERNKAWVKTLMLDLKAGKDVFAAVGSGHLVGPTSVIKLLEKEGVVWKP